MITVTLPKKEYDELLEYMENYKLKNTLHTKNERTVNHAFHSHYSSHSWIAPNSEEYEKMKKEITESLERDINNLEEALEIKRKECDALLDENIELRNKLKKKRRLFRWK